MRPAYHRKSRGYRLRSTPAWSWRSERMKTALCRMLEDSEIAWAATPTQPHPEIPDSYAGIPLTPVVTCWDDPADANRPFLINVPRLRGAAYV